MIRSLSNIGLHASCTRMAYLRQNLKFFDYRKQRIADLSICRSIRPIQNQIQGLTLTEYLQKLHRCKTFIKHNVTFVQCRMYSTKPQIQSKTRYYDILGVTPKATQSDIKSAYYRLSKLHHPDANKETEGSSKFSDISEAYETLGNTKKRRLYDRGVSSHEIHTGRATADVEHTHPFQHPAGGYERRERRAPPTGRTQAYNFDEFYRQHYADIIYKEKLDRQMYEELERIIRHDKFQQRTRNLLTGFFFVFMVFLTFIPTLTNAYKTKTDSRKT